MAYAVFSIWEIYTIKYLTSSLFNATFFCNIHKIAKDANWKIAREDPYRHLSI